MFIISVQRYDIFLGYAKEKMYPDLINFEATKLMKQKLYLNNPNESRS